MAFYDLGPWAAEASSQVVSFVLDPGCTGTQGKSFHKFHMLRHNLESGFRSGDYH